MILKYLRWSSRVPALFVLHPSSWTYGLSSASSTGGTTSSPCLLMISSRSSGLPAWLSPSFTTPSPTSPALQHRCRLESSTCCQQHFTARPALRGAVGTSLKVLFGRIPPCRQVLKSLLCLTRREKRQKLVSPSPIIMFPAPQSTHCSSLWRLVPTDASMSQYHMFELPHRWQHHYVIRALRVRRRSIYVETWRLGRSLNFDLLPW